MVKTWDSFMMAAGWRILRRRLRQRGVSLAACRNRPGAGQLQLIGKSWSGNSWWKGWGGDFVILLSLPKKIKAKMSDTNNNVEKEKKIYIKKLLGAKLIDEENLGEISCCLW
jgi:hypothetical protein